MGFFGAMGKALKAPAKAMMKAPGMGAITKPVGKVMGSVPGVNPMMQKIGLGPSQPALQNAGNTMGAAFGRPMGVKTPPMMPTPPLNQSLPQPPDQSTEPMMQAANPPDEAPAMARPDVMPQTGAQEAMNNIPVGNVMQQPSGLGPRPQAMRRGLGSFVTNRMRQY